MNASGSKLEFYEAVELVSGLKKSVNEVVFGQERLVNEAIGCFLAGGHILMTGAPGLAKTTLVRVISEQLDLLHGRVQFTPDLLPADIIGSDILNIDQASGKRSFEFSKGPVFANLLLADEINRASPRTQSALLEAMQERRCTVGGKVHGLPDPFMVFATQNPFESEGAFPLPEAQLDRFLIHTLVDYPETDAEERIVREHVLGKLIGEQRGPVEAPRPAISNDKIIPLLNRAQSLSVEDELVKAITDLVRSTRPSDSKCPNEIKDSIWYGAGPRAGISLVSMSRSMALLDGSETVRWSHVRKIVKPVLRHRIRLTAHASRDRVTEDKIIDTLVERLETKHTFLAKGIS